jgi:hypothetical protein
MPDDIRVLAIKHRLVRSIKVLRSFVSPLFFYIFGSGQAQPAMRAEHAAFALDLKFGWLASPRAEHAILGFLRCFLAKK